jgi:HK97 gp10 family phage protein
MSIGISFTIDTSTLDRITKNLNSSAAIVGKRLGEKAEGYAKGYCPVDTGNLRNSIQQSYPGGQVIAQIYTDVEYGIYQEFGTYKMAAHPFIQPGIMKVFGEFVDSVTWSVMFT